MYDVYIDVVFLVNLVPEYIIFSMTLFFLKYRMGKLRLITGSLISSGVTCILLVIPGIPYVFKLILSHLLGKTLVLGVIFRIRRLHRLIKAMILVSGFTFLMGGFLEWICQTPFFVGERQLNVPAFLLISGVAYVVLTSLFRLFRWMGTKEDHLFQVQIKYLGYQTEVCGLWDTGNQLTEPISGKPVSILEKKYAEELCYQETPQNYRVIPYYSIGNPSGILHGFTADEMRIEQNGRVVIISSPIIGVSENEVSKQGKYGLIMSPKLINE